MAHVWVHCGMFKTKCYNNKQMLTKNQTKTKNCLRSNYIPRDSDTLPSSTLETRHLPWRRSNTGSLDEGAPGTGKVVRIVPKIKDWMWTEGYWMRRPRPQVPSFGTKKAGAQSLSSRRIRRGFSKQSGKPMRKDLKDTDIWGSPTDI